MDLAIRRARGGTAVVLALCAVLMALASPVAGPAANAQQPATTADERLVALGALLTVDPQADADTQVAVALALEDVRHYLADAGSPYSITLRVERTGQSPAAAAAGLRALAADGVRVVIGPETSGELAAIRDLASASGQVLISHCSTAPSLAIADDRIFRLVPDDNRQAEAIARLIALGGARAVVQVWRDDVFGADLSTATRQALATRGIATAGDVSFAPAPGDRTALAADLADRVRAAVAVYGGPQVAVQLSAFGPDVGALFAAASGQPDLAGVRWYGSDGTAQSVELIEDPRAARFAFQVGGFPNPLFAGEASEKEARLVARIEPLAGRVPQVCALAAYDAVWLAALTAIATGGTSDVAAFARVFPRTADNYFGATGWTRLNAAGDRDAADYDVWGVVEAESGFEWRRIGHLPADATRTAR